MRTFAKGTINGRLTTDPVIRTVGDKSVCNLRLAVDGLPSRKTGEKRPSSYFSVVVWGKLAESCRNLVKGQEVYVEGHLQTRTRETDGQASVTYVELNARTVNFGNLPRSAMQRAA
jgi:single-strand DNA-binding protein